MVMRIIPGRRGREEKELISHFLSGKKKKTTIFIFRTQWIMSASWPYYEPTMFAMSEVHTRSNQMKSFVLT